MPPPVEGLRSSYRKVRARQSWDFALAGVALALVFKGDQVPKARVFLSGVAPVPWRSTEVEEVVTGKRLDERWSEGCGGSGSEGEAPGTECLQDPAPSRPH